MDQINYTVSQVANEIGESVYTVRNWIRDFRSYIPITKADNGYNQFNQDAINIIKDIQRMYRQQKLSTKQITAILSGASIPSADPIRKTDAIIDEIKKMQQQQADFNAAIIDRLDRQQAAIEQRDQQLTLLMRSMIDDKKPNNWLKKIFKGRI